MRYPKFLNKNDTVGLLATSCGNNVNPYRIRAQEGIKNFEKELVNYVNNNELGKQIYNIIHETHDLPKGNEIDQLLVEFKKAR